jgi:glutamate-1-semialdehyde 2,1-aminomutase
VNAGTETWFREHPDGHRVELVCRWNQEAAATFGLPRAAIAPGERAIVHFSLQAPSVAGRHRLSFDLVKQNVSLFSDQGSPAFELVIEILSEPATLNAELYEFASRVSPWYYQPTRGIDRGEEDTNAQFPLFVSRARGCYLWDLAGRKYVDYVMGWGSALLGYAPDRVQKAVANQLNSAPVVPFPHPLELEVARLLTEDVPSAEMVVFGRHGSDACTLAARLARSFTGRKTILFSGYHGWQDWWMEQLGFRASGIPDRNPPIIHRFRANDQSDFRRLLDVHRRDLAGVMLEPAGAVETVQGPSPDCDPSFLRAIADKTRQAGAVLIFDEIMTGFRYPGGSVQAATGIIPDLTCLGKALGGGLGLSALVGCTQIMQRAMSSTAYGPTFRGEVYPFAAAKAALEIYRSEPVASHVHDFGLRLQQAITNLLEHHVLAAHCFGPPFRFAVAFREPDPERLALKRTFYQQELLRAGVVTYNGFMLPSYAHDEEAFAWTVEAVDAALANLVAADRADALHQRLAIPLF